MSDRTTSSTKKSELTTREIEVLAAAWQCMDSEPQIDLTKLAALTGYTNPRSVGNTMTNIRKKLAALAESGGSGGPSKATPSKAAPAKKASTGGSSVARKRKPPPNADNEDDFNPDEENGDSPTPAKKAHTPRNTKPRKSPAVVLKEMLDDEKEAEGGSGGVKLEMDERAKDEGAVLAQSQQEGENPLGIGEI